MRADGVIAFFAFGSDYSIATLEAEAGTFDSLGFHLQDYKSISNQFCALIALALP